MSTKLDAAGLATEYVKRVDPEKRLSLATSAALLFSYADAIREHSQPLADELATVKAERDELLAELKEQARLLGAGGSREARLMAERDELRKALDMMGVGWVTFNALVLSDTPKIEDILEAGRLFARALDTWNTILAKYPKP